MVIVLSSRGKKRVLITEVTKTHQVFWDKVIKGLENSHEKCEISKPKLRFSSWVICMNLPKVICMTLMTCKVSLFCGLCFLLLFAPRIYSCIFKRWKNLLLLKRFYGEQENCSILGSNALEIRPGVGDECSTWIIKGVLFHTQHRKLLAFSSHSITKYQWKEWVGTV